MRSRATAIAGQSIVKDIRTDLFVHLQELPFDYFDSRPHGKILVRVINYVNSVSDFLTNGMINILLELVNMILIVVFMLSLHVRLTLVVFAGLPVFAIYIFSIKRAQRRAWQLQANKHSNFTAYLAESINGERVTQSFAREAYNAEINRQLAQESREAYLHAVTINHSIWPITFVLQRVVQFAIYLHGRHTTCVNTSPWAC